MVTGLHLCCLRAFLSVSCSCVGCNHCPLSIRWCLFVPSTNDNEQDSELTEAPMGDGYGYGLPACGGEGSPGIGERRALHTEKMRRIMTRSLASICENAI